MKLSVVILNWNAAEDTIHCVMQLQSWETLKPEIWVVDNASSDDSIEVIQAACPGIHLICNETNQGFAGGTNRGIDAALNAYATHILLLNNDAVLHEDAALKLVDAFETNETLGMVGPLLFDGDNPEILLSAGNRNPVLHHQTRIRYILRDEEIFSVKAISGTAIVIRASVFQDVGLLDETYFFSTELADFCQRASQYGYHAAIHSKAKAFHTVERSSYFRDTLYIYYIIRNRFIYIRNFYRILALPLIAFWSLYSVLLVLKLRFSGQYASAISVRLGLMDGLQGRFGGQNERVLEAIRPLTL